MSFLIPFQGPNLSGNVNDNILYQENNVFIMDNHRLALWCWFQKINKDKSYNLFHIDAHPDMAKTANGDFSVEDIDLWTCSLEQYRTLMQAEYNLPLFRWDNYIQILYSHFRTLVAKKNTYLATHNVGATEVSAVEIQVYAIFSDKKFINQNNWIVNIDIDYFFSAQPEKTLMFSTDFIESIAIACKMGLDKGLIDVLTIALSPECCGGWAKSQKVLEIFSKILGIKQDLFNAD